MTRAKKASLAADGMAQLPMAPFPAFNPWNWWALMTPANALAATLHNTNACLQAWRNGADCMRAMLREQQDAALALISAQPAKDAQADDALPNGAAETAAPAEAADFVTPMVEATRAYGRVGRAFIVAQRNSLRAFTKAADLH